MQNLGGHLQVVVVRPARAKCLTYNGGFYLFKKILKVDFSVKKSLAIRAILFDSSFAENFTYKGT